MSQLAPSVDGPARREDSLVRDEDLAFHTFTEGQERQKKLRLKITERQQHIETHRHSTPLIDGIQYAEGTAEFKSWRHNLSRHIAALRETLAAVEKKTRQLRAQELIGDKSPRLCAQEFQDSSRRFTEAFEEVCKQRDEAIERCRKLENELSLLKHLQAS